MRTSAHRFYALQAAAYFSNIKQQSWLGVTNGSQLLLCLTISRCHDSHNYCNRKTDNKIQKLPTSCVC